jgi:thiol-disulfide isomerase/thioredoxin
MIENITTILSRYAAPYYMHIISIIILIIFVGVGYYSYQTFFLKNNKNGEKNKFSDVANVNRRNKEVIIYFFNVNWCPHCKTTLPEWKRFSDDYNGRDVNNYIVKCESINCTEETSEITNFINEYGIEGYPTVKMLKDEQKIEFDSKITYSNLENFVKTMLE